MLGHPCKSPRTVESRGAFVLPWLMCFVWVRSAFHSFPIRALLPTGWWKVASGQHWESLAGSNFEIGHVNANHVANHIHSRRTPPLSPGFCLWQNQLRLRLSNPISPKVSLKRGRQTPGHVSILGPADRKLVCSLWHILPRWRTQCPSTRPTRRELVLPLP